MLRGDRTAAGRGEKPSLLDFLERSLYLERSLVLTGTFREDIMDLYGFAGYGEGD